MPGPRFQRFEKVLVVTDRMGEESAGRTGTVIWRDRPYLDRRSGAWRQWAYCVSFPQDRYGSFLESDLRSTGVIDRQEDHLGRGFEMSFDVVMAGDMGFVEGSYRLPEQFWQVFTFAKRDVPDLRHRPSTWESGITGVEFEVPRGMTLDRGLVLRALSGAFGGESWSEVRGPDSLILK